MEGKHGITIYTIIIQLLLLLKILLIISASRILLKFNTLQQTSYKVIKLQKVQPPLTVLFNSIFYGESITDKINGMGEDGR